MSWVTKTTIDSVLRDYFYSVSADRLLEDNIEIDTDNVIEDSKALYLQFFASFLIDSYYKGYIMSESIMKKLMDIIDYTGYEYLILQSYIDILNSAMIDHVLDVDYESIRLHTGVISPEESKEFILEYLKQIQEKKLVPGEDGMIHNISIPYFKTAEINFGFRVLEEEFYPIDKIYKSFKQGLPVEQYVQSAYVLYSNNKSAYRSLLRQKLVEVPCYLFFLLDNEDNYSLDILTDNIRSLPMLLNVINVYEMYNDMDGFKFNEIVNKNIKRLIELITINVTIEQTAMIIGTQYDSWKQYIDNNKDYTNITLESAILLYEENKEKFTMLNSVEYIYTIREKYPYDAYFYARQCLLNMDYKLFFNNFINMYKELLGLIDTDKLVDLCIECINGFKQLNIEEVNDKLDELYINLCDLTSGDVTVSGYIEIRNAIK